MPAPVHLMSADGIPVAPTIEYAVRGSFVEWLSATGGVLAASTYNAGKVAFISASQGRLCVLCRRFARPMGLAWDGERLALAVREQLIVYQSVPAPIGAPLPITLRERRRYATGRLDVHDVAFGERGLHFVNTRFNCISRPSERVNFKLCWLPPFMTDMIPRDCCHLNGLGMHDGRPALATAFCQGKSPRDWRSEDRFASGVVIEIPSGEIFAEGLNMPHSPRRHAGAWWFCNSGEGALCRLDPRGQVDEVAAVPGFTRGLCLVGDYAVVGRSKIRKRHILDAPPVRRRFGRLSAGLSVVELASGREIAAIDFLRGGREVYDVTLLPNALDVDFLDEAASDGGE